MDKRLFLIDGHALIFKMYYAFLRRPMVNSKGEDTSILYGFTKYLLELIEKEKPTHLAVAFDPPGKTFRHGMYPEYKANRDATPQLIIDALDPLIGICGAMRIPVLMKSGFEADDVIGSMAKKAETEGFSVYMVTPDKDYGQLISEHIFQFKPGKSGAENEILDTKAICEKYGIERPEQVIEMLTICGDASDNVPGVKGVGEVGAGKLIGKYGSVENIYVHIDELTARQKEAFEAAKDHIALSHDLVTIKTDIPIETPTDEMTLESGFSPEVAELFDRYEFPSLKKYIGNIAVPQPERPKERTTVLIQTVSAEEVAKAAVKAGRCSVVPEYDGTGIFCGIRRLTVAVGADVRTGVGAGTAEADNAGAGSAGTGENLAASGSAEDFAALLADSSVAKAGYELKRLINVLEHNGLTLSGKLLDIELMHYLINPEQSHRLEILSKSYLNIDLNDLGKEGGEEKPAETSLFDQPEDGPEEGGKAGEAVVSYALVEKIRADLEKAGLADLYDNMEEPLIRVLASMERTGVKMDFAQLADFTAQLEAELASREKTIREMGGEPNLNISSPKQIGELLFGKMNLDPKAKAKTGARNSWSTDEETLLAIADRHPIVGEILEYRGVKKLLSTYIAPFPNLCSPVTGKIHTTFNQALTATGRLSSSKPNLQNIPIRTERGKEIRKAFVPSQPGGVIMSADYSQIELRIMAHLSQDEHLTDAFRKGLDVHAITAAKIFRIKPEEVTSDQRRIAKTANFGIMYGISAFGLAQRLRISRNEAKKIIDDYFANFPAISAYISDVIASTKEKGYVETLFGRRRWLPDINSRNATVRSLAERNAINAPIQGTSADIIKMAMIGVSRRIEEAGLRSRMVLQVHDELVFDALESEAEELRKIVVDEMENVIKLSIPLTVECNYGKNWLEAH